MKKYLLLIILFISFLASINLGYAQGVAVNTDGSTADPSAVLDVKSTAKGVLVPRMALSDRNLITSPAAGLLIYQTDNTPGFYYNAGTPVTPSWTLLGATGATGSAGASGPPGAGFANGSSAGQVYLTGSSPFSPQAPQSVTGDISISSTAVTSYNNIVPANKGGAGTINGILAANGAGTVNAASTTGSGSVVLATSPTLVTPALGTIASGNGATLTGLQNIANNSTAGNSIVAALNNAGTTGTVAAVRLGTGATSTNFLRGDGTFATPPASNVFAYGGALANNTTISGSAIFYTAADGYTINLPRATTAGQYIIIMDSSPPGNGTGGINVKTTGGDTIVDDYNGTTGNPSANGAYKFTILSDGAGRWYTLIFP
jgi:hypothetical protein